MNGTGMARLGRTRRGLPLAGIGPLILPREGFLHLTVSGEPRLQ